VTSAAYRQSSKRHLAGAGDMIPTTGCCREGHVFGLGAEMIRDQALAVAGLLSQRMYGPSVRPPRPSLDLRAAFGGNLDWQTSPGEDRYRRGLYTEWRRTSPYPSMATFDAPSREVCTLRRNRSNTPLQALVTLNDPVYHRGRAWTRATDDAAGVNPDDRVQARISWVLFRGPPRRGSRRNDCAGRKRLARDGSPGSPGARHGAGRTSKRDDAPVGGSIEGPPGPRWQTCS
jgi:hypothetical protein